MTNAPAFQAPTGPPDPDRRRAGLSLAAATLPLVGLVGGWTLAGHLQPADYDGVAESVSALAATTTSYRWVMQGGLVLAAVGWLVAALALPHLPRTARVLLGVGGLATLGVVLAPMASRSESNALHVAFAVPAFVVFTFWPLWSTPRGDALRGDRPPPPWPQRRRPALAATAVLSLLLLALLLPQLTHSRTFGLWERLLLAAQATWLLVVAIGAWHAAGRPLGGRRGRRLVLFAPLLLAAAVGGTVATVVVPTTVETRTYRAEVSLSLDPRDSARLTAPTVFGDVSVRFRGLAPGLVVRPQVRDTITDVLAQGTTDLSAFEPTTAEVDAVVTDAVRGTAVRFLLGALAASLLLAGLEAVLVPMWRRRDPAALRLRSVLVPSLAATLTASAATGVAVGLTYDPSRTEAFRSTGLIGYLAENQDLLGQVESRARQVSPYIRNLLALSSALKGRYGPAPDEPVALRLLLVSDIHDGNVYDLARTVIQEEGINAVLDTGDIVDFGRVEELEAAGIPRGIQSLGVPYFFVRGNHDAVSGDDQAILRRLARLSNVVLLQPDPDTYVEADLGGLRIGGFNDPRWYGDSGEATGQAQQPAREAFAATFADRTPLDIVASHHPAAVRGLERAGLVVHGHMHTPALDGNRIQVGTLSGGGPFSHYIEQSPGEELTGQPSAFDILDIGADCRLVSLRRYSFRNAIEGRPVLDDVSVRSGTYIEADVFGDEQRTCTTTTVPTLTTVARVPTGVGSDATPSGTGTGETSPTTSGPATTATPSGDPSPWTSLTEPPVTSTTP